MVVNVSISRSRSNFLAMSRISWLAFLMAASLKNFPPSLISGATALAQPAKTSARIRELPQSNRRVQFSIGLPSEVQVHLPGHRYSDHIPSRIGGWAKQERRASHFPSFHDGWLAPHRSGT